MLLSARTDTPAPRRQPAAGPVLAALAAAAAATAALIATLPGDPRAAARRIFAEALRGAEIAALAWRDAERPEPRLAGAAYVLALSPLEGADDLEGGMPAGTLFSLRPAGPDPEAAFLAPGRAQVAAGFVVYGPRTLLTLTDGTATTTRILDPRSNTFRPPAMLRVPPEAIGSDGARGGQRAHAAPLASLAACAQRVLTRGGLHLRPADFRATDFRATDFRATDLGPADPGPADPGAEAGLRLVHEAAPIALAVEAAGGAATDERGRAILDLAAGGLDRTTPLAIGPVRAVADLARRLEADRDAGGSPLFAPRGLLRA